MIDDITLQQEKIKVDLQFLLECLPRRWKLRNHRPDGFTNKKGMLSGIPFLFVCAQSVRHHLAALNIHDLLLFAVFKAALLIFIAFF
ncbi:MAG TPA: hypothetical protein HPP97_09085 [Desulfuromonadales bacterium]|nr:hypothetical protein [Desulfuromonadales bacterium]